MTTEREEFEEWYHEGFFMNQKTLAWQTWQASRKVALNDAAKACSDLQADWRSDDHKKCIAAIKWLLK